MNINTTDWTAILSATATFAAVLIALWVAIFGPRRVTKPKLCVSVDPVPPDCMWDPSSEGRAADRGLVSGRYFIRLRVTNEGNEDARDVEVMMIRLWAVDDAGSRLIDPSFLPLLLQWSWWIRDSGPPRWLERLPTGTFKHCDFLTVTLEQSAQSESKRRRHGQNVGQAKAWMTFKPAYDPADSSGRNPLRKPPGRYQLDFVAAASNAKAIYRTAHINFIGWQDEATQMFGANGGLSIEITETKQAR